MDIEKNNNTKENNEYDQYISNTLSSKGQHIYRKNYQVRLFENYQYLNYRNTNTHDDKINSTKYILITKI